MYKSFDSPSRDYLAEWLDAEIQLAVSGYCGPVKKNIDDFPAVIDEQSQPTSDPVRKPFGPNAP